MRSAARQAAPAQPSRGRRERRAQRRSRRGRDRPRTAVGVDVERIHDLDVGELARSAFAADEAAELAALPASERKDAFFRLWTRKESIVKAHGVGISDDFAAASAASTGATLHELTCAAGYIATLASIGRCERVTELDGAGLVRAATP